MVTRNGKLVETFPVPPTLCKDPLALYPLVSLAAAGDFVYLDVQSSWPDATAALWHGAVSPVPATNSRSVTPLSAQAPGRRSSLLDTPKNAGSGGYVTPGGGGGGEGGVGGGGGRGKVSGSQLVFDFKHFQKNRLGAHLTVNKVSKSGVGAVHVKRDLWGLLRVCLSVCLCVCVCVCVCVCGCEIESLA